MEVYVQLIFVLAFIKFCLKASLTERLLIMLLYSLLSSVLALCIYPIVIEQPVMIIEQLLNNKDFVTDGAVVTTIEAVIGIFIAIGLLDNHFIPRYKRKRSIIIAKMFPGIIYVFAIAYFELLFVKWRVGEDFLVTSILYAGILFVSVTVISQILKYVLKEESLKLEMKLLLNLAILIVGLVINSSVADYNLSYATAVIEWGALLCLLGIVIVLFILGVYLPDFKQKIIKKIWN